jgi:hypothetical protein
MHETSTEYTSANEIMVSRSGHTRRPLRFFFESILKGLKAPYR